MSKLCLKAANMAKDKTEDATWLFVRCIRRLCCGNEQGKAKKRGKDMKTPSFDEVSAGTNSPQPEHSATTSTGPSTAKLKNTKLVNGNEKVICFDTNVNAKKIAKVKHCIENAINRHKQQQLKTPKTKRKKKKKFNKDAQQKPTTKVCHGISRRDRERLPERRAKLKQLKSKDKKAEKRVTPKGIIEQETTTSGKSPVQLPIGARGFAKGPTDRKNRFALHYIAEDASLSDEDQQAEMEDLFGKLTKLNSCFEIALRSYKDVVKSLIKLQVPVSQQKEVSQKWNSEWIDDEPSDTKGEKSTPNYTEDIDLTLDRMTVSRLLAPETRRQAIRELQELVEELNVALDDLHVYYDDESGNFDIEEYNQSEFRITAKEYDIVLSRTEKLLDVAENLLEHYSKELMAMFEPPVVH